MILVGRVRMNRGYQTDACKVLVVDGFAAAQQWIQLDQTGRIIALFLSPLC